MFDFSKLEIGQVIDRPYFIGSEERDGLPRLPVTSTVSRLMQKIIFRENNVLGAHLGPCWIWTGRLSRNGYGRSWYNPSKKEIGCHRIMYFEMVGPIPKDRILDHLCRWRACCSPWHVEPVTHKENTARGNAILFKRPEEYLKQDTPLRLTA
jgi:hypothetical protein